MSKHLSLLARTADSISMGDTVERKIRVYQAWGLLPTEVSILTLMIKT